MIGVSVVQPSEQSVSGTSDDTTFFSRLSPSPVTFTE